MISLSEFSVYVHGLHAPANEVSKQVISIQYKININITRQVAVIQ